MGAFHGLYFAQFLAQTETAGGPLLSGAAIAEIALMALFAALGLGKCLERQRRDLAPSLANRAQIGLGWFAYGIWG